MGTIDRFHAIKDELLDIVEEELQKDVSCIDTHELGEVIDIIKDCTESVRNHKEAEYYSAVVKAMKESEEPITMATLASDPSAITRRMYYSVPEYASLKEFAELVDSGADSITRYKALDDFAKKFSDELASIDISSEEKEKLKSYMASL